MFPRTRKLPWPMSRIDRDCLHELWQEGQRSGKPITAIVAEAVVEHLNRKFLVRTAETPINLVSPRAAESSVAYQEEPLPAA